MRSLPLPVRVAAGVAATAVEQARALPGHLVGLPVTMASEALQLSMRIQQQVTELAIKGDTALAGFRRAEEQPSWATFDEDETEEPAEEPEVLSSELDVLPDYDNLTLPQLRGKLRAFGPDELERLLAHEQAHGRRPEFVRMLSNRLERLRSR